MARLSPTSQRKASLHGTCQRLYRDVFALATSTGNPRRRFRRLAVGRLDRNFLLAECYCR